MAKELSAAEKLKAITAEKKELAAKQKALREELDKGKDVRKVARGIMAQCRKDVRDQKAKVRDLCAKIYSTFSENDVEAIEELADNIMEAATEVTGTVRKFATALKDPEDEDAEETEEL